MSASDRTPPQAGTPGPRPRVRWSVVVGAVLVAVVIAAVIGGLYQALGGARQRAQRAAATERAALLKQADAHHANTVKQSLTRFGVPLAWAMRREIVADNWEQVDRYVAELAQLEGVEEVVVARADGAVAAASDPSHVGIDFRSLYAELPVHRRGRRRRDHPGAVAAGDAGAGPGHPSGDRGDRLPAAAVRTGTGAAIEAPRAGVDPRCPRLS